jgi:hypothetical protein
MEIDSTQGELAAICKGRTEQLRQVWADKLKLVELLRGLRLNEEHRRTVERVLNQMQQR